MSFFGAVVRPGKAVPYMPPPEPMRLHLSQVALGDGTKGRVTLRVRVSGGDPEEEDEQPELGDEIIIAVLEHGKAESQTLDLVFDTYAEFTATGGEVHVSGYYVPEYDEEDVDDDDDEEDDYLDPEMMDEEELAEMYGLGSDSDEDEEDGEERRLIPASRVKIEEIDADGKPVQPGGGAKGGAGEDDSDDDEDEDDEDMDDDDDDEEEEEDAKPKGGKGSKGDGKGGAKGNAKGDGNGGAKGDGKASGGQDKKRRAEEGEQGATPGGKKAKADGKDSKGAHGHSHDHGHGHGHDHSHCDHGHGHSHGHDHKGDKEGGQGSSDAQQQDLTKAGMVKEYENGFKIEQLGVGKAGGAVAKAGKQVVMKYVGKLAANGRVFDQSKSFKFRLGVGEVIKGWDRGIVGMRVGDRRRLTIPPQMAYGPKGVKGSIPPNATLVFEVELVSVK